VIAGRLVMLQLLLCCHLGGSTCLASAEEARTVGERIALARLKEIRAVTPVMRDALWSDFDPAAMPAVIHQPGGWAVAVGFTAPPAGFTLVDGVKDGDRNVYHAGPGVFRHVGRSPALVSGQWAVVSRFEPPEVLVRGDHLGRRNADEVVADFVGDAFLIYLMGQRKSSQPFASGPSSYPDDAELMALTAIEQRILMKGIRMPFNEKNLTEFQNVVRQIVAVHRARWAIMGPELAAAERETESWEGLREFVVSFVFRAATSGTLVPAGTAGDDITFQGYRSAVLERMIVTDFRLMRVPDNPTLSPAQIAGRAGALAWVLDRFAKVAWRLQVIPGDKPLVDFAAEELNVKLEDEAALLQAARSEYHYDAALALARADLGRIVEERQATLRQLMPPARRRLQIRLNHAKVLSYQDDPDESSALGGGWLLHPTMLQLKADGLELTFEAPDGAGGGAVLTRAGARRSRVEEITILLPDKGPVTVGGKPAKARKSPWNLTDTTSFEISASGLTVRLTAGSLSSGGSGVWEAGLP